MHGLRFVVLPRFFLILLPVVSITALAADDTRILFHFDDTFDVATVKASNTAITMTRAPMKRLVSPA